MPRCGRSRTSSRKSLKIREYQEFTEIHMVGGENPHLDFSYYTDLTRALRVGACRTCT